MAKGTLTVRVISDTKPAERGLKKFTQQVDSTGDRLQAAGKKMTVFASVPIAAAMGVAANAASNLEQAIGGTEAVFGEATETIDKFAKDSAQNMGLSEREFREATTSIGGQLKRMTGDVDLAAEQSVKLTGVAADLAATYGGTTAEAVQALGAAFRGEADPAERFNLNLKVSAVQAKAVELGLAASTKEVDENARAQATLALIMEQSADAQGQFAREADTAAGQMQRARASLEDASAEIGAALLPAMAKGAEGVAKLAQSFGDLPESVQTSVVALAAVVAAIGPVTYTAGKAVAGVTALSGALTTLRLQSMYAAGALGGAGGLAAGLGAVTAILGTGAILWSDYSNTQDEAARRTDAYREALSSATEDVEDNIDSLTKQMLLQKDYKNAIAFSGVSLDDFAASVRESGDAIEKMDDNISAWRDGNVDMAFVLEQAGLAGTELGDTFERLAEEMGVAKFYDLIQDLDGMSDAFDRADESGGVLGSTVRTVAGFIRQELAGAMEEAIDPTNDIAEATEDWRDSSERLNDRLEEEEEAIERVETAIDGMNDAYGNLIGVHATAEESLLRMREGFDSLNHLLQTNGSTLDENSVKGRENRQAITDQVEAIFNLTDAMRAEGATSEEVGEALEGHVGHLRWVMEQAGLTKDEINEYLGVLNLTPESIATYVELQGVAEAEYALALLTRDRQVRLRAAQIEAQLDGQETSGNQLRHGGGPVVAGSPYLIGRPGHEEMFVPNTSGHVLSGPQTDRLRRMGGGSGASNHIEINLNGGDHDAQSIARHVAWALA